MTPVRIKTIKECAKNYCSMNIKSYNCANKQFYSRSLN